MNFILNFLKNLIFYLIFDIDISEEDLENKNINDETLITEEKKSISYLKIFILSTITFISFLFFINYINNNSDIDKLQDLLNELVFVTDWTLYRDIFLNVQKILNNPSLEEKKNILYVLNEIHSFFLCNNIQVKNLQKFNEIMKEIISLLSKDE